MSVRKFSESKNEKNDSFCPEKARKVAREKCLRIKNLKKGKCQVYKLQIQRLKEFTIMMFEHENVGEKKKVKSKKRVVIDLL